MTAIDDHGRGASDVRTLGASPDDRAGGGAAGPPDSQLRRGQDEHGVAHDLQVTKQTVGQSRTRFLAKRLDGLLDEPRPGAPRTVSDADVERMLTRTLETKPAEATHWSIRSMAQACGLSRSTINRIW